VVAPGVGDSVLPLGRDRLAVSVGTRVVFVARRKRTALRYVQIFWWRNSCRQNKNTNVKFEIQPIKKKFNADIYQINKSLYNKEHCFLHNLTYYSTVHMAYIKKAAKVGHI